MNKNNPNKKQKISTIIGIAIFVLFIFVTIQLNNSITNAEEVSYTKFLEMVENKEVDTVTINFKKDDQFVFTDFNNKLYETENPKYDNFKKDLLEMGVTVEETSGSSLATYLPLLLEILFLGGMFYLLTKSMGGQFEKKTTAITPDKDTKTFKDVAGLKQVKSDMMLLVDFLKNPKKYHEAGAKLPKGVIFNGPPGTGKTLLAKAIAGEANVPFYSVSGSDFVEMFVGLGAKRVRDLFANARKNAPCIVFIDELDAIGGSRSAISNNSEQRQTINALLAEMDGFSGAENILVIAATNRIEDLDTALIRPGRFDKHITVPLPETAEERLEVIKIYAKDKKWAEDVNFDTLSKETLGFSPADIQAVINEAALISVQKGMPVIDRSCIDDAIFKKLLKGHAKDDAKRNIDEGKLVAWHEAGHAVIGKLTNMDVSKVTIVPSTSGAGGVNIIIPKKLGLYSIEELKNQIKMTYAGRCAELMLFGDPEKVTTGASSDIRSATELIYEMISVYGMNSEYGMLNLHALNIDNKLILEEAVKLSKQLEAETLELLKEHKDLHQAIVDILIEKETISGEELDELYHKFVDKKEEVEEVVETLSVVHDVVE